MRGHFYFQNQESCILFLGTLTHHTLRSEGCDPGHLPGPGMGFSAYCKAHLSSSCMTRTGCSSSGQNFLEGF